MNEKKTIITLNEAKELKKKYPTPFYVYDEKGIADNADEFIEAFSWNEGFKEYFAVKATPNPAILKLLKKHGCGVDCASETELLMAQALGFKGEEIMFSSNETADREFALAYRLGAIINLDDITHVEALEKAAGVPKKICLRYNPGGDFKIDGQIMGQPSEAKYGMTRAQLTEAAKKLKSKGAEKFGIHAFLASNTVGNDYYPALAGLLTETAVSLEKECGIEVEFINLSGGLGVPYRPGENKCDVKKIGEKIRNIAVAAEKKYGRKYKIFTESGRYMLAPYGQLVSEVIRFKHTYKEYAGLDACAANLMRPAMYGAYHHITVLGKENEKPSVKYDVVGSLCENNDKFAVDRLLPKLDCGDIIVMHDAGAHGFSMGYNYNGKLRSAEILKKRDGTFELIRRAETAADYFATFDMYEEFDAYTKNK